MVVQNCTTILRGLLPYVINRGFRAECRTGHFSREKLLSSFIQEFSMKKKIFAFAILLVVAVSCFAQTAPKKVLTAADVDNFIKNYRALDTEFEALGDKYDEYFSAYETDSMDESPAASMAAIRSATIPAEITAILKKYGFGENGFEKIIVIGMGYGALALELAIKEEMGSVEMTPEMKPYIDGAYAQVNQLKAGIHKDDLSLISARLDKIAPIMEDE